MQLATGVGGDRGDLWRGLHFLKGFWKPTELGGRSLREELPAGMAPLLMLGPGSLLAVSTLH